jgi:hypothetical protein
MFMYQTGFEGGDLNQASAVAVVFFLIVLGITLVGFRAMLAREFVRRGRVATPIPAAAVPAAAALSAEPEA